MRAPWALAVLLAAGCGGGAPDTTYTPPPLTGRPAPPPPPAQGEAGKVSSAPIASIDTIAVTLYSEAGDARLPDTPYEWTTDEHSGWVFPAEGRTDERGLVDATWIPGFPGSGEVVLSFTEDGKERTHKRSTFTVAPPHPPNSAINAAFSTPLATGYAIDMTPLAEPLGTFYTALHWDGGYAGLQREGHRFDRQLQFLVWDRPEGDASVVEEPGQILAFHLPRLRQRRNGSGVRSGASVGRRRDPTGMRAAVPWGRCRHSAPPVSSAT